MVNGSWSGEEPKCSTDKNVNSTQSNNEPNLTMIVILSVTLNVGLVSAVLVMLLYRYRGRCVCKSEREIQEQTTRECKVIEENAAYESSQDVMLHVYDVIQI
ncbi:uncharacterized protein [Antedon mediterranea]|uniref:uncharacterized protein n=1 Tax=Antedon mediterranea TaxID=105859 RepID=UPI003AF54566